MHEGAGRRVPAPHSTKRHGGRHTHTPGTGPQARPTSEGTASTPTPGQSVGFSHKPASLGPVATAGTSCALRAGPRTVPNFRGLVQCGLQNHPRGEASRGFGVLPAQTTPQGPEKRARIGTRAGLSERGRATLGQQLGHTGRCLQQAPGGQSVNCPWQAEGRELADKATLQVRNAREKCQDFAGLGALSGECSGPSRPASR